MARLYAHMCRDGHEEVGYNGDGEQCPVCRALGASYAVREHALEAVAAWRDGFGQQTTPALDAALQQLAATLTKVTI